MIGCRLILLCAFVVSSGLGQTHNTTPLPRPSDMPIQPTPAQPNVPRPAKPVPSLAEPSPFPASQPNAPQTPNQQIPFPNANPISLPANQLVQSLPLQRVQSPPAVPIPAPTNQHVPYPPVQPPLHPPAQPVQSLPDQSYRPPLLHSIQSSSMQPNSSQRKISISSQQLPPIPFQPMQPFQAKPITGNQSPPNIPLSNSKPIPMARTQSNMPQPSPPYPVNTHHSLSPAAKPNQPPNFKYRESNGHVAPTAELQPKYNGIHANSNSDYQNPSAPFAKDPQFPNQYDKFGMLGTGRPILQSPPTQFLSVRKGQSPLTKPNPFTQEFTDKATNPSVQKLFKGIAKNVGNLISNLNVLIQMGRTMFGDNTDWLVGGISEMQKFYLFKQGGQEITAEHFRTLRLLPQLLKGLSLESMICNTFQHLPGAVTGCKSNKSARHMNHPLGASQTLGSKSPEQNNWPVIHKPIGASLLLQTSNHNYKIFLRENNGEAEVSFADPCKVAAKTFSVPEGSALIVTDEGIKVITGEDTYTVAFPKPNTFSSTPLKFDKGVLISVETTRNLFEVFVWSNAVGGMDGRLLESGSKKLVREFTIPFGHSATVRDTGIIL